MAGLRLLLLLLQSCPGAAKFTCFVLKFEGFVFRVSILGCGILLRRMSLCSWSSSLQNISKRIYQEGWNGFLNHKRCRGKY
jgi:hypothetical protein